MKTQWRGGELLLTGIQFDAQLCLMDSAQSFVWREHKGAYYSVLHDAPIRIKQVEDGVRIYPVNEAEIEDYLIYLDLLRDYEQLALEYAEYPCIVRAVRMLPGLRVLNQPTWETLLCFILSANNNVARIRKLTWLLSEHYGALHMLDDLTLRSMPSPEVLAQVPEADLRKLGFGYRAPFLIRTAQMVLGGFDLDALRHMDYEQAHAQLVLLPGVGDKVADCVLLMGCGHASAFPVDVWVDRLMRAWFPLLRDCASRTKLQQAARQLLGEHAGLVQQFLFHCARCSLIPLEE
ncbi:hypothetical protein LJC33_08205 [Eubacteriales bacterium OttesenSCG-928-N13]|nr:hypothetical protein [Eubacteriales bacterium OttesenSCG-928-N13]